MKTRLPTLSMPKPGLSLILLGAGVLFSAGLTLCRAQTLAQALDAPDLIWETSSTFPWFGQTTDSHDGVDSARSGAIGDSKSTYISTHTQGPGTLSFYWRVSSEQDWDYLVFTADYSERARISGKVPWTYQSYHFSDYYSHSLIWTYIKDEGGSANADAGWVDQVVWTPDPPVKPKITQQPFNLSVFPGDQATLSAWADGYPFPDYYWVHCGTNLASGFNQIWIAYADPTNAGPYILIASNVAGMATSVVAMIEIREPLPFKKLGEWREIHGIAERVFVTNGFAYVAYGTNGLAVLSVKNPAAPVKTAQAYTTDCTYDVAIKGSYAFVADGFNGLVVYPTGIGTLSPVASCVTTNWSGSPASVQKISVESNLAFLSGDGVHAVDISDPAHPRYLGLFSSGYCVAPYGRYAYVGTDGGGVLTFDMETAGFPILTNFYGYMGDYRIWDMVRSGNVLFGVGEWQGLSVWDISSVPDGALIGNHKQYYRALAISGNLLYAAGGWSGSYGVECMDVSNPSIIRPVGRMSLPSYYDMRGLAAEGRCAYVAQGVSGLGIYKFRGEGVRWLEPERVPGQPPIERFRYIDGNPILPADLPDMAVQYSDDCLNWYPMTATITLKYGVAEFLHFIPSFEKRFYRVLYVD